ncbi:MAG: amidohydrolase family protein [Wenzhouxiangella sp.]
MRVLSALICIACIGLAQAAEIRQPVPGTHALIDVRIVTEPGRVIETGSILIQDGVISAVGADISIPPYARRHVFPRQPGEEPITVFPGLIEPYFPVELELDEADEIPEGRHGLMNPDRRLTAAQWPENRINDFRRAGFTTVLMAPAQGLLRGHGLIANTGEGGLSANRIAAPFAQFASFDGRSRGGNFPTSLMGAVALMRQTFADAAWQAEARAAWARNPAQTRPQWLEGLDDLAPALNGSTPLVFESQDLLDSLRILEFIAPGQVDLVLVGHGAEYQRLNAFGNRRIRHILPLNFPDAPDVRDENDRDVSLEALRHWHAAPANPARVAAAGLPILFTSHGLSAPNQIFERLARAVERGLAPDLALAALTTDAASWLGIADRAGRIRPGAMANLVVVEGELFKENPSITEVWVDGQQYVLAALVPPTINPAGTWSLVLGLGGMGDVEASLILSGPVSAMEGVLTVMGNETPLSEVRISGDRVIASIDASRLGGSGTISIRLEVDGDRARGSGSGPFGEFTVRGTRTSGPDEQGASL